MYTMQAYELMCGTYEFYSLNLIKLRVCYGIGVKEVVEQRKDSFFPGILRNVPIQRIQTTN